MLPPWMEGMDREKDGWMKKYSSIYLKTVLAHMLIYKWIHTLSHLYTNHPSPTNTSYTQKPGKFTLWSWWPLDLYFNSICRTFRRIKRNKIQATKNMNPPAPRPKQQVGLLSETLKNLDFTRFLKKKKEKKKSSIWHMTDSRLDN